MQTCSFQRRAYLSTLKVLILIPQVGSPRAGDKYFKFKLTVIRMYDNYRELYIRQYISQFLLGSSLSESPMATLPHRASLDWELFPPSTSEAGRSHDEFISTATVRLKLLWFKELENKENYNS